MTRFLAERDRRWIYPAACMVGIEYAAAISIGLRVGFSYELALSEQLVAAFILACFVLLGALFFFLGRCLLRQVASPVAQLRQDFAENAPYFLAAIFGIALVALQIGALSWTKSMIPLVTTFWADPVLAEADRAIFGSDPWSYLHLVPAPGIDALYSSWAFFKFGLLLILFFVPASSRKARALLAYFLTMMIGVAGQYALPSGGPVFYQRLGLGDRFADLPILPMTRLASDYLWRAYEVAGGEVGGGISAFPSIHVAIALWIALAIHSYSARAGAVAFAYYAVVCFGSVYLGWHYALDGLAATLIASAAWYLSGQALGRNRKTGRILGRVQFQAGDDRRTPDAAAPGG